MITSTISAAPTAGVADGLTTVQWSVGADNDEWTPTPNDEVRLTTTSGVMMSRAMLSTASLLGDQRSLRNAKATLVMPPFPGAYVLTLVDCTGMRRVVTSPYRVIASSASPISESGKIPPSLRISPPSGLPFEVFGRVEVSFSLKELTTALQRGPSFNPASVMVVLCTEGRSDNDGYLTSGCGPFDHCARVVPLPLDASRALQDPTASCIDQSWSVAFVAPANAGRYEARVMATARCGVPLTICRSPAFDVRMPPDFSTRPRGEVFGTISIVGQKQCVVGEQVTVRYDVTSPTAGPLLSPLDRIVFFPLGRSESIVHHESLCDAVGVPLYSWTKQLEAPLSDGCYNVALYSVHEQQTVLVCDTTLLVVAAEAKVSVDESKVVVESSGMNGKSVVRVDGGAVPFVFTLSRSLYRPEDRVLVYDECANLVGDGFTIAAPEKDPLSTFVSGTATVVVSLRGKYSAHYYSSAVQRIILQVPSYIKVTVPPLVALPSGSLSVLKVMRSDTPLEVLFVKSDTDGRSHAATLQDCIAVYANGCRDEVAASTLDDPDRYQCVHISYLRGASKAHLRLQSLQELIGIAARLVDMNTTDESLVTKWSSVREWSVRYLIAVEGHFHRLCVSEAHFSVLPPAEMPHYTPIPLHHVPLRSLATVVHRGGDDTAQNSSAADAARRGDVRESAAHQAAVARATPVVFQKSSDFSGVLMVGASDTSREVVCTFHVTSGCPRIGDRVMLYTKDLAFAVSEVEIKNAADTSADLTLGTVLLNPPALEGLYSVGYYSDKEQGIVFSSDSFRCHRGETLFEGPRLKHGVQCVGTTQRRTNSSHDLLHYPSTLTNRGGKVKLLVVGVSYLRRPYELAGCLNDVDFFTQSAIRFFFDGTHPGADKLRVLHEMQPLSPTASRIREGLDWLASDAEAGDHVIFYYSGAGAMVDGNGSCLLPTDYDWGPRLITYSELEQRLADRVAPGAAVTCILDASFWPNALDAFRHSVDSADLSSRHEHPGIAAGQRRRVHQNLSKTCSWRAVLPPRGVYPPTVPSSVASRITQPHHDARVVSISQLAPADPRHGKFLIYESSSGGPRSSAGAWEAFLRAAGKTMGLFTYNLCVVLNEQASSTAKEPIQWWELHERVCRNMKRSKYVQHPRFLMTHQELLDCTVKHGSGVSRPTKLQSAE